LSEPLEKLVTFFKALAAENRLRIVALLAHQLQSVEDLAANPGVSSATVSHHLEKLRQADLVEARVQQYYNVYMLRADVLRQMAEQLLSADAIKSAASTLPLDRYASKVLDDYLVRGRLKEIPRQLKKRQVILRRLAEQFEPGKRYSEKRVNEILKRFHADCETIRRELVRQKLLAPERGYYRRVVTPSRGRFGA